MDFKCKGLFFMGPIFTEVKNPGNKSHEEFPVIKVQVAYGGAQNVNSENQVRGVYGYFCFGEERLDHIMWHPPQFINYQRQVFFPPLPRLCNYLRMWVRAGVRIGWSDSVILLKWMPPPPA